MTFDPNRANVTNVHDVLRELRNITTTCGLVHDGADLRRCDLLPEFAALAMSATEYEHFTPDAQARIDRAGYGYIQSVKLGTYNRIVIE